MQIPILVLVTLGASVSLFDGLWTPSNQNTLSRADGIILLLFFSIFIYYLYTILTKKANTHFIEKPKYKVFISIVLIALGLGGIIFGSDLVVNNIAAIAEQIGISQKIISVTIIAIGTSLPELVTTVVAAKKGENNMAIGNIVGSNIFNICIVLGLPVVIMGDAATSAYNFIDGIFLIVSVLLLWIFTATDKKLNRYEAIIFIVIYGLYGGYIFLQ